MFAIEKFKVKGSAEKLAKKMIKAQLGKKAKVIGSGSYGSVWGSPDSDVVFKIGDADDNLGYLSFVKTLAKQKEKNVWFPEIYGMRFIKSENESNWGSCESVFVVAMEKLNSIEGNVNRKYREAIGFFEEELERDRSDNDAYAEVLGVKRVMPDKLKQALKVLRDAEKSSSKGHRWGGAGWDLHSGNFMLRGKQIVVTDPLA